MAQAMMTSEATAVAMRQPTGLARPAEQPGRTIAIVLGPPGSGLGLCSRVLRLLGVAIAEPAANDPLGALHDQVLRLFDRPFDSPYHDFQLPAGWWADQRLRPLQRDIGLVLQQLLADGGPIGLQDPRIARLLPLWHQVLRQFGVAGQIVLCLRNPARLAHRGGLDPAIAEYRWFVYVCDVFRQLRDCPLCIVDFDSWFTDPDANARRLAGFLGLGGEPPGDVRDALADIVDPALRHDRDAASEARHPFVRSFYRLVRGHIDDPDAREPIDYIVDQFVTFRQLHRPFEREFEALAGGARQNAADAAIEDLRQTLKARDELLQQATEKCRESDAALARALQDAELREATAEMELATLRGEIAARDTRLAELSPQLEMAAAAVEQAVAEQANRHEAELQQLVAQLQAKQADAAALQEAIAARDIALQQAAARVEELTGQVQAAQSDAAAAREALAAREAEAPQAASRVEELTGQVQAAQADAAASREALAAREAEVQQALAQRAEADATLARTQQHAALRDAAARAAAEEAAQLRAQLAAVEAQLAAATRQIDAGAAQRQVAQGEVEALRAQLAKASADATEAAAEHSRVAAAMQAEAATLREALAARDLTPGSREDEAAGLRGWLAAAHEEIATLRRELESARAPDPAPEPQQSHGEPAAAES